MEKRIYDAWDVDRETFLGILKKVRDEKLGERFVGDIDCILFRLFDLLKVGMSDNERVKKGKFELRMMFADHLAVALDILNSKIQQASKGESRPDCVKIGADLCDSLHSWQKLFESRLVSFGRFVFGENSDFWQRQIEGHLCRHGIQSVLTSALQLKE